MSGTASTVRAFLLLEDAGPWGQDAVRDSRLPGAVKSRLARLEPEQGVRPLLIRRPGARRRVGGRLRVFAARVGGSRGWLGTATVDDVRDLLSLDVSGLPAGPADGFEPHSGPLFLVCTHGRHDTCCAERGRPLAFALAKVAEEHTWEVSHVGGDRFAANVLVLPDGLYYGRVTPEQVRDLVEGHHAGRLDLDHLRGRSSYPFPVQVAEIHLRRHLGLDHLEPLPLLERRHEARRTTVVLSAAGSAWQVDVVSEPGSEEQLTCRSARATAAPAHRVVGLRRR